LRTKFYFFLFRCEIFLFFVGEKFQLLFSIISNEKKQIKKLYTYQYKYFLIVLLNFSTFFFFFLSYVQEQSQYFEF
jgi:hypothetical protein